MFGFPASMLFDCILDYPGAKTVADVLKDIGDGLGNFQIIGVVGFPEDPECSDCISVSSGGETVNIGIKNIPPSDLEDVQPGDTVVIAGSVGSTGITADGVDEVGSGDNGNSNNNDNNSPQGEDVAVDDSYDITDLPPGVAPPNSDLYNNLYDVDNSGQGIQIISDF